MFKRWRELETDSLEKMIDTLKLAKQHGIPCYGEKYTKTLKMHDPYIACYIPLSTLRQKMSIFCKCTKEQYQFLNEVGLGNFTYEY